MSHNFGDSKQEWIIIISPDAAKTLKKLDRPIEIKILNYIHQKLIGADDPRIYGKRLSGPLAQFWSFRVIGDYRLIADIIDNKLTIDIIRIGHRKEVYDKEVIH